MGFQGLLRAPASDKGPTPDLPRGYLLALAALHTTVKLLRIFMLAKGAATVVRGRERVST